VHKRQAHERGVCIASIPKSMQHIHKQAESGEFASGY
jgi:hypothetical protein